MAVDIIARAMAANASGGGGSSSDFPIIDATGDTEVDLDNYLEEGTWFIKGNNVKQMKNSIYEFVKTAPSAILTIRTPNWVSNDTTYQSLEFSDLAYSTSTGYQISNYIGARKIKPSIDDRFQFFSTPTRITNNYTSGIFNDAQSYAFSQSGANELYTELIEAIGEFGTSYGLAKLTNLKTTDKHSLINAINELVGTKQDKLTAGSGITIENNVISALGGGDTEVKILSGDYYNPIKLYEITEQGKYLLNGYAKKRETNSSRDNYGENKFVLIVLNVNNTIFQYIVGIFNQQLRLEYRIGTEGGFIEHYIASDGNTFEPYNNITIYTGKQIGEYYGNKYQLTTTDKTSLVNAINEINAKISSGTFATNLTEVQGYDATKTQVLKNINGQFTWVDES